MEAFVRKGPNGYGDYCAERLRRLMANGERKEVPCWIELEVKESTGRQAPYIPCKCPEVSLFSPLTGCKVQEAHRRVCGSDGRPQHQPAAGLGLHIRWSLPGSGWQGKSSRHVGILPLHHLPGQGEVFRALTNVASVPASVGRFLSDIPFPDVVPGQLQPTCDGWSVPVRAGEGRPMEVLRPQGGVHALARQLSGPCQYGAHLQAGHQGDQVRGVHLWHGEEWFLQTFKLSQQTGCLVSPKHLAFLHNPHYFHSSVLWLLLWLIPTDFCHYYHLTT